MSEERELSKDLEKNFVLSIIHDPTFREYSLDSLDGDFLKSWEAKAIFNAVRKMWNKKKPINFLSVMEFVKLDYTISDDRLKKILSTLEPIVKDEKPRLLDSLTSSVSQSIEREVAKSLLKTAFIDTKTLLDKEEYQQIVEMYQRIGEKLTYNPSFGRKFWEGILSDSIQVKWAPGVPLCAYGVNYNDNKIWIDDTLFYDGIGRGQICFIQADSSVGKTTFLQNIAVAQTIKNYNVDYYSLEMPYDYIVHRTSSILTDIPTKEVKKDNNVFKKELRKIDEEYPGKGELYIYDIESRNLDVNLIRYNAKKSERDGRKVDCICIDYIDIMQSSKSFKDKRFEIGYNTQAMRDLGKEINACIISPTKQNRAKEKSPTRTKIAEDYSKVYTADNLIILSSEESKDMYGTGDELQTIHLFQDKNRYGDSGVKFSMLCNRSTGRFFDPFARSKVMRNKNV
jgi:replicative DNA helicase